MGSAQESPERILKDLIPGFRVEPRRIRTLEERRISNRSPSAANETDNDGVIIAAARLTAVPATRISEILRGRRRITAETALRLSAYFANSAGRGF